MEVGYNVTVRLVISTVGAERNSTHSIHIHGHSVHVLKVGYGEYSSDNGALTGSSRDLTCTEDGDDSETIDSRRCPNPRFRSPDTTFPLTTNTVRKDTFIVPAGGYVVVQFRSDNPGYWLLQCNVELYYREGMAIVIKEAVEKIIQAPEEMKGCDPFLWVVSDFIEAIEGGSGRGSLLLPNVFIMSSIVLAIVLYL